ncbi:MAG: ABC transporter permease [Christensenellaceae bacterium]|jgi:NitT/TauT family transport system permease protein|nr:ABC transporter permease [Christensenellaceae bacterium]
MRKSNPAYSAEHLAFLQGIRRKARFVTAMRYLILVAFLLLWELAANLGWIDPFIASSPGRLAAAILRLYSSGDLFMHIGITLFETIVGFVLGTAIGTLIAILLWWSATLNHILDPYLVVLNALPKVALGPILIVWFGAGMRSIIVMALLISLIVTVMSVLAGFNEITGEKQQLMRTLGANKFQILTMIVLPASVPTIMNALKISVGMSWVGVIMGEYLVSKAGLGYLIVYGSQVFKLDLVMASIVILCVLAAMMYYGVAYLERKIAVWRR